MLVKLLISKYLIEKEQFAMRLNVLTVFDINIISLVLLFQTQNFGISMHVHYYLNLNEKKTKNNNNHLNECIMQSDLKQKISHFFNISSFQTLYLRRDGKF